MNDAFKKLMAGTRGSESLREADCGSVQKMQFLDLSQRNPGGDSLFLIA